MEEGRAVGGADSQAWRLAPRWAHYAARMWRTPPGVQMREWFAEADGHSLGSRLLMLRVPQSCSQLDTRERHKKPPAGAGEDVAREPAASCRSSLGGPPPACRQPGPPGLALPQKAPGGSRGTPGGMPSRVPCDVGLNREIACGHPAWTAGWFSHPVSPGFHPGLLGTRVAPTKSPRREPGRMLHANLRPHAAICLAGRRPLTVNPALRAWRFHKKPPAGAGGLRVACLPGCHAMWV